MGVRQGAGFSVEGKSLKHQNSKNIEPVGFADQEYRTGHIQYPRKLNRSDSIFKNTESIFKRIKLGPIHCY